MDNATMSNCLSDQCPVNEGGRKVRIREEQESREVGNIWSTMGRAGLIGHYNGIPFVVNPMMNQVEREDGSLKSGMFKTKTGKWTSVVSRIWNVASAKASQEEEALHNRMPDVYPIPGMYPSAKLKEKWFSPMHKKLSDLYMAYSEKRKTIVHDDRAIETSSVWSTDIVQYDSTYWIPLLRDEAEYDHRKSDGVVRVCPCCGSETIILSKSKDRLVHECAVKRSPWKIGKIDYVSSLDGSINKTYKIYVDKDTGTQFSEYEALSENNSWREWKWYDVYNKEVTNPDEEVHTQYKIYVHAEGVQDVTEQEAQTWVTNFWTVNVDREHGVEEVAIWKCTEEELHEVLGGCNMYQGEYEYDVIAHALRLRLDELGRKALRVESWEERKYLHQVEETKISTYEELVAIEDIDDEKIVEYMSDIYGVEEELDDYTVAQDEWM